MQPEHRIRLRGGWEYDSRPSGSTGPRRVALPLPHSDVAGQVFRLGRGFQAPPVDPASESLFLELDAVPGLRSVVLNGQTIAQLSGDRGSLTVPLAAVNPRGNRLVLEVGPVPNSAPTGAVWGSIALLIRPRPAVDRPG